MMSIYDELLACHVGYQLGGLSLSWFILTMMTTEPSLTTAISESRSEGGGRAVMRTRRRRNAHLATEIDRLLIENKTSYEEGGLE